MSSKRTSIRSAISQALISATTSAGSSVFTSRYTALMSETYPLILIETPQEPATPMQPGTPPIYERRLTVIVSAVVSQNDTMDDAMDSLADQIEAVFGKDPTFGGICNGSILKSVDSTVDSNGEQLFGAIHVSFEVTYLG